MRSQMTFGKQTTGFLIVSFLSGCATAPPPRVEDAPKPPPVVEAPKPKPYMRELGSLWSPDSRWNDIFSSAPLRFEGDVLTIHLTDTMLARITGVIPRDPFKPENKPGNKNDGQKGSSKGGKGDSKDNSGAQAKQDSGGDRKDDSSTVEAVIKEVLPRGVFRVSVNQTVSIGSSHPTIILEGKVHERDIATDESFSSDALFNVSLNLSPTFTDQLKRLANGEPPLVPQSPMAAKAEEKTPKAEAKK